MEYHADVAPMCRFVLLQDMIRASLPLDHNSQFSAYSLSAFRLTIRPDGRTDKDKAGTMGPDGSTDAKASSSSRYRMTKDDEQFYMEEIDARLSRILPTAGVALLNVLTTDDRLNTRIELKSPITLGVPVSSTPSVPRTPSSGVSHPPTEMGTRLVAFTTTKIFRSKFQPRLLTLHIEKLKQTKIDSTARDSKDSKHSNTDLPPKAAPSPEPKDYPVILKLGEDPRKSMFCLGMCQIFNRIWEKRGVYFMDERIRHPINDITLIGGFNSRACFIHYVPGCKEVRTMSDDNLPFVTSLFPAFWQDINSTWTYSSVLVDILICFGCNRGCDVRGKLRSGLGRSASK